MFRMRGHPFDEVVPGQGPGLRLQPLLRLQQPRGLPGGQVVGQRYLIGLVERLQKSGFGVGCTGLRWVGVG